MQEKMTNNDKELEDEIAMLILFMIDLVHKNETIIGKEWEEFTNEIKYKSFLIKK